MTEVPPRATSRRVTTFVRESQYAAGTLALALLFLGVVMPEWQQASPRVVLPMVLALGMLQTAVFWAVKAKLRSRWPSIDALS
jgi:hypothetical protein